MDFAGAGRYDPLDPLLLPPLVVAWRAGTAADSGPLHSDLRARFARGDEAVVAELARAATAAHDAREASSPATTAASAGASTPRSTPGSG